VEEKNAVNSEVNRLYWETEESVADISNRLGVSRRALYEQIEPMPAGAECTTCGAELYFSNRSAKLGGVARCLMCGAESSLGPEYSHEDVGMVPPFTAGMPHTSERALAETNNRAATIAGYAIAGVVVGAIATVMIKRQR
jgi:hypothetical protein